MIESATPVYTDGFGGCGFAWIFLVFILLAWNNNGYNHGNLNGALTRSDLQQGFDNQTIQNKLDQLGNKVNSIGDGLCNGFYTQNTTMLTGFNGVQRDILTSSNNIAQGVNENRFTMKDCCCTINRNIDSVRYENARNTCDIVRAIEKDGEETRKLIVANQMQDLRDRITAKDQELQTANFQLSQQAQSANLISTLRPTPIPAYVTCSPYVSSQVASYGLGCAGCGA